MSVVLDSREMAAVNFHHEKSGNSSSSNSREMKRKVDDVMMRGISCFLGSGFHEKMSSTGSCRTSSPGRHAEDDLFCDYHHQRSDDAFGNIPMVALSREYNLIRGDHATAAAADQAGFSRVLNAESDSNSVSSSIGAASSSSSSSEQQQHLQEEDGEEVQSERKSTALLPDFGSLEESLPLKRGLSNCFGGKSKSFGCLSDAVSLKDLVKSENPYNKRRRILLSYKNNGFGRSAAGRGFHSTINLTINSHVSVVEEEEEEEEEDDDDDDQHEKQLRKEEEEESSSSDDGSDACIISPPILHQYHHHHHHPCSSCCSYSQINRGGGRKLKKKFTSPRSFSSLTDLRT